MTPDPQVPAAVDAPMEDVRAEETRAMENVRAGMTLAHHKARGVEDEREAS